MTSAGASPGRCKPSLGIDERCLSDVLGHQVTLVNLYSRRAFARHVGEPMGLKPVEFSMLMLLDFNADVTQKQLTQALDVSAPNMTILIDRLVGRGWLDRVRSQTDRRAQKLHLTPAGHAVARQAHETSKVMEVDLLRHLSGGERAMLLELLGKVARGRGERPTRSGRTPAGPDGAPESAT